MKLLPTFSFCLLVCTARAVEVDDLLDRLDTALTVAAFQDNLRARLSGTIDLEAYHFQQPAPGLVNSKIDNPFQSAPDALFGCTNWVPDLFFRAVATRSSVRAK